MYNILRQSTAVTFRFGPLLSPSDGITLMTGAAGTGSNQLENATTGLMLAKAGGSYAVRNGTPTASVYDTSDYKVTLNTTDTGTLGELRASIAHITAYAPYWRDFKVVPANVYDAMVAGSANLNANIAAINGDTTAAATLASTLDGDVIGTVNTAVNGAGSSTSFSCSNITEATANHFKGKQVTVNAGTLTEQYWGVVTASILTNGENVFTVSPGSPTGEALITTDKVTIGS